MNNTIDAMCFVCLTVGRESKRGASLLQSRNDLPLTQTESHSIATALTITCTERESSYPLAKSNRDHISISL